MVLKVGDRVYWEKWAKDVAIIAQRQIERITHLVDSDKSHEEAFNKFLEGLQQNINPTITKQQSIEMLSQHIITKPVFEALFENYSFVSNNPVSKSMQNMLDILEQEQNDEDFATLQRFYESVKKRVEGIDNAEGKQKIIVELYDKFFKTAFPKMVEQLGIVYTPVEVVDFIINSVNDVLKQEFKMNISDDDVHVLDPFTGTGTFITRLIQSGLIDKEKLLHKYKHELHANEIILLAYYIATVNIENALHDQLGSEEYYPFEGIVLTDTFQLGEAEDNKIFSAMFPENSERLEIQRRGPIRVIMGNPPYSVGQKSANDNAVNQEYKKLDSRIAETYVANSNTTMNKANYDAYIKAFRWSSDRLDKSGGVIAFVSNGAWLDGNTTSGFRKCLEKEFSSIWVFNLRGNQRTSGELSRKEGGKIFGSGSRTPISITILVKNPNHTKDKATIHYHDIGDYLTKEDKLKKVENFKSIKNMKFDILSPNEHGDWISQRNDIFDTFIPLADKSSKEKQTFFNTNSNGIVTNRDAWVYNSSKFNLTTNMKNMIDFYNQETKKFLEVKKDNSKLEAKNFVSTDEKKIKWVQNLYKDSQKGIIHEFKEEEIITSIYRPFFKQYLYKHRNFIGSPYLQNSFFPNDTSFNRVISITGIGASKDFTVLMVDKLPNLHFLDTMQSIPLYYYEEVDKQTQSLFDQIGNGEKDYIKRDGISDFILKRAIKQYGKNVSKVDIFYYIYGFLHIPKYREEFEADLKKMLPKLPLIDNVKQFWEISKIGHQLSDLHVNYENIEPYSEIKIIGEDSGFFKVQKMKFPKKDQKDTIIFKGTSKNRVKLQIIL